MTNLSALPGVMNSQEAVEYMEWAQTPEGQAALMQHTKGVLRRVFGPEGVKDLFGTENVDPDAPSRTFDERVSRCYELAACALLMGTAPKGSKLIHGSMHGPGAPRRIGHAWLRLPGGKVWEPIQAKVYDEKEWTEYASAKVERVYTRTHASRMLYFTEQFGRWHNSRWP